MMQREITVKEIESIVNETNDIEPIIVKRNNMKDLLLISLEQYEREMFYRKLEESEKEYREGKVSSAEVVFKELRDKYNY